MSRTVITAVVGVVIAVLTAIAYFMSGVSLDKDGRTRADARLNRAYQVVQRIDRLASSDVEGKAERLAAKNEFVRAIKAKASNSLNESTNQARLGFQKFMAEEKGGQRPDRIALIDGNGEVVAEHEVGSVAKQWKNEDSKETNPTKLPTTIPAVNVALNKRVLIADQWNDGKQVMRIGVAPVIDPEAPNIKDPESPVIIGAIMVAYAQTGKSAQADKTLLGTDIAYFDNKRVVASSFTRGGSDAEDTTKASHLTALLASGQLNENAPKQKISIDGSDYLVAGVKMPRSSTKTLPEQYPASTAGAIVLSGISEEDPGIEGKIEKGMVPAFILLLGGGAFAIALLGIYLTHRRLVTQADLIEQGVTDIINGNLDRTFRPVGTELDGLANGLNVMLARVLGRPEPGEEEFDEEGNPIIPGRVDFEEGEEKPTTDPDLAALAQESEPDYYKRVYTEYLAARRATSAPDDVSFENFIAKLKVNEGKLRAQYQCRAVRFRVVTKDGKVSLKPVPIFA